MENPFTKTDEDLAAALKDDETAADDETSELFADAATQEVGDTTQEESDGADADADEDDAHELFKADSAADKERPKSIPIGRLNEVIDQRNDARQAIESMTGELESLRSLTSTFQEKYADRKDADKLIAYDADFMNTLEELSKHDAAVAGVVQAVQSRINYKGGPTVTKRADTAPDFNSTGKADAAPAADPRVDAVLERDARRQVTETLETLDIKPSMRKLFTNLVVANADDLADLDEAAIKADLRAYIRDNGLSAADVLGDGKADAGTSKKPATTNSTRPGRKSAATPEAKAAASADAKPKTTDEWRERFEKKLEGTLTDLYGS